MVTIKVPSGKEFCVHAHLLRYHSDYFKAALNSEMMESKSLSFDLELHADEGTVRTFVDWVYAGQTNDRYDSNIIKALRDAYQWSQNFDWDNAQRDDMTGTETLRKSYQQKENYDMILARAWHLGDYLQAEHFCKDVLEGLHESVSKRNTKENPLINWPAEVLETLHTDGKIIRLFAAILGNGQTRRHRGCNPKECERRGAAQQPASIYRFILCH